MPQATWRATLACLIVPLLLPRVGAHAAHEWRAEWASPQSFEVLERAVSPAAGAGIELRSCLPYGAPGLRFGGARVGWPGQWEVHAGCLDAVGYGEWHAGVARILRPRAGLELLLGLRWLGLEGVASGGGGAATVLVSAIPPWLSALRVTGGLVDQAPGSSLVPAIAVWRVLFTSPRARLLVDRSSIEDGVAETSLVLWFGTGSLGLMQGYRWAAGETSLALTLRSGRCCVTLGQRWHPALGVTPRLAIAWGGIGEEAEP